MRERIFFSVPPCSFSLLILVPFDLTFLTLCLCLFNAVVFFQRTQPTQDRWSAFKWAFISGISEPIGAALGWLILAQVRSSFGGGGGGGVGAAALILLAGSLLLLLFFRWWCLVRWHFLLLWLCPCRWKSFSSRSRRFCCKGLYWA